MIGIGLIGRVLLIVSERILDIGVDKWHETGLLLTIIKLDLDMLNLEDPSNNSKILEIMVAEILVDIEIFAEVIGPFKEVEVAVVLLDGLLPELTFINFRLGLVEQFVLYLVLVHGWFGIIVMAVIFWI